MWFSSRALLLLSSLMISFSGLSAKTITILHTNDWQSRLLGFGPNREYQPEGIGDGTQGGVARLATLIQNIRKKSLTNNESVFVFDAGDFTMGTLFHTVSRETGGELQLLNRLGYDAVAIGNHEFDFGINGIAQMVESARRNSGTVVPLLASNMLLSVDDTRDESLRTLKSMGYIKRNFIIERNGIKVGVFGLMGKLASEVINNKGPVKFEDIAKASSREVKNLKAQGAELIVCLSHSGITKEGDEWRGEEYELAKAVPEIDIIVGGHSHIALDKPIHVGSTVIVQAGSDVRFMGELKIDIAKDKLPKFRSYKLHAIDDKIIGDRLVSLKVKELQDTVSELILKPMGINFEDPIAEIDSDLTRDLDKNVLGNLVAQAYKFAGNSDIGFEAQGNLRDDIYKGQKGIQSFSDLFRIVPLGVGEHENTPGYPLIKVFFSGKDLKAIMEVLLIAYQVRGEDYYPRLSGVEIEYSKYRVPFDRVTKAFLVDKKGKRKKIINFNDSKKLYSIVTTSYVGNFFWIIPDVSMGLFKVSPKNSYGQPIVDIKNAVLQSTTSKSKQIYELKAWQALLTHIQTMLPKSKSNPKLSVIPTSGYIARPTIIKIDSMNPTVILTGATWIMWSFLCGVMLFFILVPLFFRFLKSKSRKKKQSFYHLKAKHTL